VKLYRWNYNDVRDSSDGVTEVEGEITGKWTRLGGDKKAWTRTKEGGYFTSREEAREFGLNLVLERYREFQTEADCWKTLHKRMQKNK
jgi:hypothetical protein